MKLISPNFKNNEFINKEFTCQGANKQPQLNWKSPKTKPKSFVLICDDSDAPQAEPFVHWVVYNIPPSVNELQNLGRQESSANGIQQGKNSFGKIGYDGPCPPAGKVHHYIFTLYAVDIVLDLKAGATKKQVLDAINCHVVDKSHLIGLYQKP